MTTTKLAPKLYSSRDFTNLARAYGLSLSRTSPTCPPLSVSCRQADPNCVAFDLTQFDVPEGENDGSGIEAEIYVSSSCAAGAA